MENKISFLSAIKFTTLGYLPVQVILAFLSLFGVIPVNVNDHPLYGIWGFILMLLYAPVFGLLISAFFWVFFSFGVWMTRRVSHKKQT